MGQPQSCLSVRFDANPRISPIFTINNGCSFVGVKEELVIDAQIKLISSFLQRCADPKLIPDTVGKWIFSAYPILNKSSVETKMVF